ncbi:TetR/AcrR family transcriptional regulator C-terminal domain-containing protein [Mesorhizobium australicum]|uniref:TetR/AcrR family transcriptional regulator C-terminal domain-containing protein n=1 Tax=Mesorhizobium australicum TaxID=536018 RepID=UPI000A059CB9
MEQNGKRVALSGASSGGAVHSPPFCCHFERLLEFLAGEGMAAVPAMELLMTVGRYTVGCVMEEQAENPSGPGRGEALDAAAHDHPLLHEALVHYRAGGHEALFESGLGLLIAGAEVRMVAKR